MYLSHFVRVVSEILPPTLRFLQGAAISPDLVLNAALSLGAASLANFKGSYTCYESRPNKISWSIDGHHRVKALHYAGKALSLAAKSSKLDIDSLITSHLILSYVEVELGTFQGLRHYITSINALVLCDRNKQVGCIPRQELMQGVQHTRAVLQFVAGPWTHQQAESDIIWSCTIPIGHGPSDPGLFHRLGNAAMLMGCRLIVFRSLKVYRNNPNNTMAFLIKCGINLIAQADSARVAQAMLEIDSEAGFVEATRDLDAIAKKLRKCEPPPELSDMFAGGVPLDRPLSPEEYVDNIVPLHFGSHEQAMNAADYSYAQLFCNQSQIEDYLSPLPPKTSAQSLAHDSSAYRGRYQPQRLRLPEQIPPGPDFNAVPSSDAM